MKKRLFAYFFSLLFSFTQVGCNNSPAASTTVAPFPQYEFVHAENRIGLGQVLFFPFGNIYRALLGSEYSDLVEGNLFLKGVTSNAPEGVLSVKAADDRVFMTYGSELVLRVQCQSQFNNPINISQMQIGIGNNTFLLNLSITLTYNPDYEKEPYLVPSIYEEKQTAGMPTQNLIGMGMYESGPYTPGVPISFPPGEEVVFDFTIYQQYATPVPEFYLKKVYMEETEFFEVSDRKPFYYILYGGTGLLDEIEENIPEEGVQISDLIKDDTYSLQLTAYSESKTSISVLPGTAFCWDMVLEVSQNGDDFTIYREAYVMVG